MLERFHEFGLSRRNDKVSREQINCLNKLFEKENMVYFIERKKKINQSKAKIDFL